MRKMPTMYTKDKNNRITLRLNDEQFEFVRSNAEMFDVSPSDMLRMLINATMATAKIANSRLSEAYKKSSDDIKAINYDEVINTSKGLEGEGRENDKTDINDLV